MRHGVRAKVQPAHSLGKMRIVVWLLTLVTVVPLVPTSLAAQGVDEARGTVRQAVELVGGSSALRNVQRVVFDMVTQWSTTQFRDVPFTDRPAYEFNMDVRDYSILAWRNTRGLGSRRIVDLVRDSVAVRDFGKGFTPLSVAYVDERDELFLYTPDRLLLALLDTPDLHMLGDTLIGGERHRILGATLGDLPVTVLFHSGTGLLAVLRFQVGQPNDYGLVPWGRMQVEVWYSNWRTFGDVSIPTQWDIVRVGKVYKRITIQRASFNPEFAADSFAVSSAAREAYFTSIATRPMHEGVQIDSTSLVTPSLAEIQSFGTASGAVRTGAGWLLLGVGQTPFNYTQSLQALRDLGVGVIEAVLVGTANPGNGGVLQAVEAGLPVYVSPASKEFVSRILRNGGHPDVSLIIVSDTVTLGSGPERVFLEPLDLPNVPGSLVLFQPQSGWLFIPDARTPLDIRVARRHADGRGWTVRAIGTQRNPYQLLEQ